MFNLAKRRGSARLPQADEFQNEDHHHYESNNVKDVVHIDSSFLARPFEGRASSGNLRLLLFLHADKVLNRGPRDDGFRLRHAPLQAESRS
jgi:hypothetical protein